MNIIEEALKLNDTDKFDLIGKLWNDLDEKHRTQLSSAKKKFLDERIDAIDKGNASFVMLEEIKSRYYSRK